MNLLDTHFVIGLGFKWVVMGGLLAILLIISLVGAMKHKFRKPVFNWLLVVSFILLVLLFLK